MSEVSKKKKREFSLQVKCPPGIVSRRSFIIHDFHRRFNLFLKFFTKTIQERRLFRSIGSLLLQYDIMTLVK
ncbi:hypothetical protein BKP29_0215675 [Bacillus licheniformis]|nr:hypothetical protein BKP29_0215675 [Bacillus licheniformis]